MSRYPVIGLIEIDELFPEVDTVQRKRGEERLVQIGSVQAHGRHIGIIGGHAPEPVAFPIIRHGRRNHRAAVNDRLHQSEVFQYAHRVCRKPNAGADLLHLGCALKDFDPKARLPQSDGRSESTDTGANDDNLRLCRHDRDPSRS